MKFNNKQSEKHKCNIREIFSLFLFVYYDNMNLRLFHIKISKEIDMQCLLFLPAFENINETSKILKM